MAERDLDETAGRLTDASATLITGKGVTRPVGLGLRAWFQSFACGSPLWIRTARLCRRDNTIERLRSHA